MSVADWDAGVTYMGNRGLLSRLSDKLGYIWRRYIPHLVFEGDEIDVRMHFKGLAYLGDHSEDANRVYDASYGLHASGVRFDIGSSLEGCDWELDHSLRGPVSITFKGLAKSPELRE